tara:strand:- start:120 stop:1877 length:1758 start_codon:yes stop_codon:yes gene_type:complete
MCGITAISSAKIDDDIIKKFNGIHNLLKHRGPDQSGISVDLKNNILLGHHRLSIIDINSSRQPYKFENIELIFNGEIYNYLEVRNELKKYGYKFSTKGDTEVLIKAFHKWRKKAFMKFDGMFTCIFKENNKITLSTDFFGEKPIYLYQDLDNIYLCSEPYPLVNILNIGFKPSKKDMYFFLGNGFMDYKNQGFQNLRRVKPGYIYEIKEGKIINKINFFNRRIPVSRSNTENAEKKVEKILIDSVIKRARADVDLGVFLSSGIDSVLTACLLKKVIGKDFICLTSTTGVEDEEYFKANEICKFLGIEHKPIFFENKFNISDAPKDLVDLYTVPNDNLSGLAIANLSKYSENILKVAFVGTGADEIFAGYNKYKELFSRRILYDLNFGGIFDNNFSEYFFKYLPRNLNVALRKNEMRILSFKNSFFSDFVCRNNFSNQYLIPKNSNSNLLNCFREFDLNNTLQLSYNDSIDRGTMRYGIEARSIYLNKDLYEYTKKISNKDLLKKHPKPILRKILKSYLPEEIIPSSKRGFTIGLSSFYRNFKDKKPSIDLLKNEIDFTWNNLKNNESHIMALRLLILEETFKRFA